MLPSILAKEVTKGLKSFITTGFETETPFFSGMFEHFVEQPDHFIKGPYLSAALPFARGDAGHDFFPDFTTEFPPHRHQQNAWQRLATAHGGRSTLIATGTGSGKTECFLYPVLDYCLRQHLDGQSEGIKAIVIYPMNALATDQAKRFARLIHRSEAMRSRIRVGLFIGESEEQPARAMSAHQVITDKNRLREQPPDILLTNYKMLDFLLLRPKDRPLWRMNKPDTLRYLVVDELHTFDGAQGTDLACLIRRLKSRLRTPDHTLIGVGTSATLGSGDERNDLRNYAARIFQDPFDEQSIIDEQRQGVDEFLAGAPIRFVFMPTDNMAETLDHERYDRLDDYLDAQYRLLFPGEGPAMPGDPQWRKKLGEQLKQHQLFYNLLRSLGTAPTPIGDLLADMRRTLPESAHRLCTPLLNSLCALIAIARDQNQQPLLNLRVQLWVRELRRMVTPLRRAGRGPVALRFADDHRQEPGKLALPLLQCSQCHATVWLGRKIANEPQLQMDLRAIYQSHFQNSPESIMLLPLNDGERTPEWPGHERTLCAFCATLQPGGVSSGEERCLSCGEKELLRLFIPDMTRHTRHGLRTEHHCPVCAAHNSMMVFGSRSATLSSVAIHHGFSANSNDDKKLIAFSDNVQDAAHRAGFFEARTWHHNIRMAIAQAIPDQEMALEEFYCHLPRYWRDTRHPGALDDIDFICTYIAPDMAWLRDYETLIESGTLPEASQLPEWVEKRLEWEVLAEFGYRSRIGRSLERTATAAAGIRLDAVVSAADALLAPLKEQFGLRHLKPDTLRHFILGLLLYMKQRGAIFHPFLDSFIRNNGNHYILKRQRYLPLFGERSPLPRFLCSGGNTEKFDPLVRRRGSTWYQSWFNKVLMAGDGLVAERDVAREAYPVLLDALVRAGLLRAVEVGGGTVWGINPNVLYVSRSVAPLETANARSQLVVPESMARALEGMPSLLPRDAGHYQPKARVRHWLQRLYLQGEIRRIVAREHTGLLDRQQREEVEREFTCKDRKPWYANLLSATPTLEMGIDIGDLSSVLLCSVPPSPANYLQRTGRAGRKDGNAFTMTVATGSPHDLYFYAEPDQMMSGKIDPPGLFLNAATVLKRQLTAFCMDCWVASGIDERAIPARLKAVLDHVEKSNLQNFPYNFIDYVKRNSPDLLEGFLALFKEELSDSSRSYLRRFLTGGDGSDGEDGLELALLKRFHALIHERGELKRRITELGRYLKSLEKQPGDEATQALIKEVTVERGGLQSVLRSLNGKQTMNFFTDEGLLPNYAFPESGVVLRSVIYRKKKGEGAGYENRLYEYERAGEMAIGELAPANTFYAGGRKVEIQQVDMQISEIEWWRFCPACSHSESIISEKSTGACPRCKNPMWSDSNQKVRMLRLRRVMANTHDRDSRLGDDRDSRDPVFYTRQMLVDIARDSVESAWRINSNKLPFGFEFVRKATFREINFGKLGGGEQPTRIAGEELPRPGFRLCRHCGMVQKERSTQQRHAYACKHSDPNDPENIVDCLYLYREFTSEALRILLPACTTEGNERSLNSFVAALQLGLKLKFGGKVDHLRIMDYAEPVPDAAGDYQRRYLMLYDSVPGGTGYLHELMQAPEKLLELFRLARDTMARCDCNQDPEKDGCYRCLYAFRNSHGMETTSRNTAVEMLSRILDLEKQFKTVTSIDGIRMNPILESELELRFIEALKRAAVEGATHARPPVRVHQEIVHGKPGYFLSVGNRLYTIEPQANIEPTQGVEISSRPDFLIRSARTDEGFRPIALFLDGYKYHRDKVTDDSLKRLALVQSGKFWQWSLTWDDVHHEFAKSRTESRNPFVENLQPSMQELRNRLKEQMQLDELEACAGYPALLQLLCFLQNPGVGRWRDYVFSRALAWFDQKTMMKKDGQGTACFRQLAPTWITDRLEQSEPLAFSGVEHALAGTDPLRIICAVPLDAIRQKDSCGIISTIHLDCAMSASDGFKRAWQGFLHAYNLMQFLPNTALSTSDGIEGAAYASLRWHYAESAPDNGNAAGAEGTPPGDGDVEAWISEVLEEFQPAVRRFCNSGHPPPEVGYELQGVAGEIIAEAELAWITAKCVALTDVQHEEYGKVFLREGWRVATLDHAGAWTETVGTWLTASQEVVSRGQDDRANRELA